MKSRVLRWWAGCLALVLMAGASIPASAQGTTAGIQGTITDDTGPLPGATIVAKETGTGFTYEAVADSAGFFALKGLTPGTYEITVAMPQYKPQAKTVQVLVGQNITLSFRITPDLVYSENVTVVGTANRLVETKTAEISTSVTAEQVRYLPQNQRNFLNFANLAPGVKMTQDDQNKQVSAGGQDGAQVNVFIDGVSYKNDVLQGGVVGQDSSRGSPFPQNAVQEFQVLTQNYKAEHEKASSAVITAVTKSGTNRWSGDGFLYFQNKGLVALDTYSKARALPKPTYERFQPGLSVGGPIVKDTLQIFGAYEENRQNRDAQVFFGGTPFPASLNLDQFQGTFPAQFRERLLFTKATYQPKAGQHVDVSYSERSESDVRDFGIQNSFESANDQQQRIDSVLGRWQVPGAKWLNELTGTYQRFDWNPRPLNPTLIGREYVGVLRIGGRDTTQDFVQQRTSLRNDYTRFGTWNGNHTMKAGAVLSFLKYDATKLLNGNPLFQFRSDTNFAFPSQANYGFGIPTQTANNKQIGFFAQDDWAITGRLTLNAGVRWDYESDMLNNNYVTPAAVRSWATTNFNVNPSQYLTDGTNRPPFYGAWQPRLGLSYDLTGEGKHILFGGYGRYYDRVTFNSGLDEAFRLQYSVLTFRFSTDGRPDPNGNPTLAWNPAFLSKAGLDGIVASGLGPKPEVFLIDNKTKPPVADQFNGGIRTVAKGVLLTANYAGVRARNGFTFIFGNRNPDGGCCRQVPGTPFSNLLLSSSGKKNWYDALFLTADRPFDGKWGLGLAYTLGKADAIGGDLFSLDYRTPADYPRHPTPSDERNRVVATSIVGLPYDFLVSGFVTISSGLGFTVQDSTQGFAFGQTKLLLNAGRPDHNLAYRTVDLRLEKIFKFGHLQRASIAGEAFNIFNYTNDACYDGFEPQLPTVNAKFGQPSCVVDNSTRRFQVGIRYSF
jgi:outer membrane receptor protein involved in Fe transport